MCGSMRTHEEPPPPPLCPASVTPASAWVLPALLVALAAAPEVRGETGLLLPGDCPLGEISHVFIDNHSIFDPAGLPDEGLVRRAYVLTNRLHIRTRPAVIRRELTFRVGDCFDPAAVRESARILREFRFIAAADVFGVPQPDGTRHVVVDTRDEWTTKTSLGLRFDDGLRFEGASIVEENFLGRGAAVGAYWLEREEQRQLGGLVEIHRVGRSYWDTRTSVASTRVGEAAEVALIRPFHGEAAGTAVRAEFRHRRDLFSYVVPRVSPEPQAEAMEGAATEWSHLVLPVREQRGQMGLSHRMGSPGRLAILGGGVSFESVEPFREEVEGVRDGDFSHREGVEPEVAALLQTSGEPRQAYRINLMAGVRQIEFMERRGLDAVAGVQDLPLGREAILTVGRSIGSTGPDRPPDLWSRVNLFRSGQIGPILSFATLTGEARRELGGAGPAWKDGIADLNVLNYWNPGDPGSPTLLLRASARGGWRPHAPFQLTLGGPDGVRGYSEQRFPGARRVVLSGEARMVLPNPLSQLADLGMTVFGDAGRMWAGDAPLGTDTGWKGSVGAGLRIGFPAGTSSVIRIDLAIPTGALEEGRSRSPTLRISAREWLGVLNDTRSHQIVRSRRSGMTADFSSVVRERRPPG